eukprot:scaffold214_cov249-Pinguiococcus_pyrenoidosus.AAC.30
MNGATNPPALLENKASTNPRKAAAWISTRLPMASRGMPWWKPVPGSRTSGISWATVPDTTATSSLGYVLRTLMTPLSAVLIADAEHVAGLCVSDLGRSLRGESVQQSIRTEGVARPVGDGQYERCERDFERSAWQGTDAR